MTDKNKPSTTFNKSEYDKRYVRQNVYRFTLYLHKSKDKDIISALEQQGNKAAFIKGLIRNHINQE